MLEIDSELLDAARAADSIYLNLEVSDPIVVGYLRNFRQHEIATKATEALKVGVIALRSACTALDANIVEQKFKELERSLDDYARDFASELQGKIEQYFKADTGSVPRTLEEYFGLEHGRLSQVVRDQIGPQSDFGKLVDPDNKI